MIYKVIFHRQFDKDVKRLKNSGWDVSKLQKFVGEIRKGPPFPERYEIHSLQGDMQGVLDGHVVQNWVVLFRFLESNTIEFLRTGTHGYLGLS